LHDDPKQRISAEEALADPYFGSQDSSLPKKLSMDEGKSSQGRLSISPQNARKRVSFDISRSNSTSLKGSLSEATSSQESSTLSLSPNNSFRKLSENTSARSISPSRFKPQSQETQRSISYKRSSENLILQKINFNERVIPDDEDSDIGFDETSPLPQNYPIASPRTKKHPSQRI